MNPAQMKSMMRQFGIKSEDLDAKRVIIELEDGSKLVFDAPSVNAVDMKGTKTYTISGEPREEKGEARIPNEDIEMVAQQANVSTQKAKQALEQSNGDIAEAIAALKNEE